MTGKTEKTLFLERSLSRIVRLAMIDGKPMVNYWQSEYEKCRKVLADYDPYVYACTPEFKEELGKRIKLQAETERMQPATV